jgi:hypothetical protein
LTTVVGEDAISGINILDRVTRIRYKIEELIRGAIQMREGGSAKALEPPPPSLPEHLQVTSALPNTAEDARFLGPEDNDDLANEEPQPSPRQFSHLSDTGLEDKTTPIYHIPAEYNLIPFELALCL